MLPKYHILYGGIFAVLVWILFSITIFHMLIIFLTSFLIDTDHYLVFVKRKKDFNFKRATQYFLNIHTKLKKYVKKGIKVKTPFVILHTIEFLILIAILSLFNNFLFFIFIGILFHSLLDIIDIYLEFGTLTIRHFSTISYFLRDRKNIKQL